MSANGNRRIGLELGLPEGYGLEVCSKGNPHLRVLRPDGSLLRLASGMPIQVALTPGDRRARLNEKARIRRAIRGG